MPNAHPRYKWGHSRALDKLKKRKSRKCSSRRHPEFDIWSLRRAARGADTMLCRVQRERRKESIAGSSWINGQPSSCKLWHLQRHGCCAARAGLTAWIWRWTMSEISEDYWVWLCLDVALSSAAWSGQSRFRKHMPSRDNRPVLLCYAVGLLFSSV